MIDSLKKLAIAVIVLVAGVVALSIYIVNREAKIGKQAQTIEQLTASEKVHLEEIDKIKKSQQLYKEQVVKFEKELQKAKKIKITANATVEQEDAKFLECFDLWVK